MFKFHFCLLGTAILTIATPGFSQTYTTGREAAKADVNFTELANYYKAHPKPFYLKPLFNEDGDEDERPEQPEPDPAFVHLIQRNAARVTPGSSYPAFLPVSPAPVDSFQSTESDGSAIPPDTHGEVDSNYCVTAINTVVHIQTRNGINVSDVPIDGFWSSLLAAHGDGCFDPRVHYDPNYNRWIMVCDVYGQTTYSQINIAVSATGNPTGTWHMYSVIVDPTGANWLDFPCVGFNGKWITVTGNLFSNSSGNDVGAVVYVFNYADIMAGTGAPYTKISETSSFTLCPAQTYDTYEQSMFLLEVNSSGSGKLQLWKLTGPVGSPVIASVGYPATTQHWHNGGSGDFAPQLGTTNKVQAGDDRITSVTQRNNYLWCAHTVFLPDPGSVNRCSVMWWQIDTLANPVQNGLIDDATTPSFFDYASITVNRNNDVLVGHAYLSANMYPSAAYSLHMHYDTSDSMRPSFIFRHGQANYYLIFAGTQNRWGDYSASCLDPINNTDFWTIQESVPLSPTNYWDTWWAHIQICPGSASFTKSGDSVVKDGNDTLTFSGSAPAGATVTWNFGGGTGTPGTGTGAQNVKWTTGGWKVITLSVTDSGCTSTFTDSVFVKSATGLNELTAASGDFKVIPNPNDGSFNIVSGWLLNRAAGVKITDMLGKVVYSNQFDAANTNTIPVKTDGLANGNYILSLDISGTTYTTKITVER